MHCLCHLLHYILLLQCLTPTISKPSQMLTGAHAAPGLCLETTQLKRGVLPACVNIWRCRMTKNCRNPTFSWVTAWHTMAALLMNKNQMSSFWGCPYVHYSIIENSKYIPLPHNIADFNDIFCIPLNGGGLLQGWYWWVWPFSCYYWLVQIAQTTTVGGCYTPYQNSFCLLLCNSHISNPYHMVTFSQLMVILMNQDSGYMGS